VADASRQQTSRRDVDLDAARRTPTAALACTSSCGDIGDSLWRTRSENDSTSRLPFDVRGKAGAHASGAPAPQVNSTVDYLFGPRLA